MNKAVFLDRDGVINEMVYNPEFGTIDSPLNPGEFVLIKGVAEAIKIFKERKFLVVAVSNQPPVAKGKMTLMLLNQITRKMKNELKKSGAKLDGVYYCLHHSDPDQVKIKKYLKKCDCRKPKPGLLLKAAKDLKIDLSKSFMIGDGLTDIEAGKAAGCKTIFLGSLKAYYIEAMNKKNIKPDFIAKNLFEAAKMIENNFQK